MEWWLTPAVIAAKKPVEHPGIAFHRLTKKAIVFTDYWKPYPAVVPPEQHRPVGQETEETAHIERWNNTLRQHLGRFVRKTLSFSKCFSMHEICLKLFLHRYNTELLLSFGYD